MKSSIIKHSGVTAGHGMRTSTELAFWDDLQQITKEGVTTPCHSPPSRHLVVSFFLVFCHDREPTSARKLGLLHLRRVGRGGDVLHR
jgi:hypothetical protein